MSKIKKKGLKAVDAYPAAGTSSRLTVYNVILMANWLNALAGQVDDAADRVLAVHEKSELVHFRVQKMN